MGFKPVANSGKQKEFNENIVDYIVGSMKPFSTVDDAAFVKLFSFDKDIKIMSRSTLMRRIEEKDKQVHNETVVALTEAETICTVGDIWSTKHHGYLGMTCHWLNDKLERRGRVLACRNFKSPHTADRIAEQICSIHEEHGLDVNKIISTITDNASNMVKAFKDFGVNLLCSSIDGEDIISDDEEPTELDEENLEDGLISVYLPTHQRFVVNNMAPKKIRIKAFPFLQDVLLTL